MSKKREKKIGIFNLYEQTWQIPVNNGFHNIPAELLRLIMRKIPFWDSLKNPYINIKWECSFCIFNSKSNLGTLLVFSFSDTLRNEY